MTDETARARRAWDRSAPSYDRRIAFLGRVWCSGCGGGIGARPPGPVREVAMVPGRNLEHYPADARITGVELSPVMLGIAREHARRLGRSVELHEGDAQRL